jgi:hypothetical protein
MSDCIANRMTSTRICETFDVCTVCGVKFREPHSLEALDAWRRNPTDPKTSEQMGADLEATGYCERNPVTMGSHIGPLYWCERHHSCIECANCGVHLPDYPSAVKRCKEETEERSRTRG